MRRHWETLVTVVVVALLSASTLVLAVLESSVRLTP